MVAPRQQPPLLDLVEELLAEQSLLQTPVVRASVAHDQYVAGAGRAALSAQLIPLTAPGPGEQYAFEVDLDACTGCKACVVACHSLNGLDENEAWRDVGFLTGGSRTTPYQQTVTTACHHCADPGCLNGCPVLAYEKDPVTGIVRHLDDQCIGCQYCILKCPYDVPKYNERLGIVRKCDLCHQRLGAGEAPACAQACPTQAIKVVKVSVSAAGRRADTTRFLAAAPAPAYTQPTTRYVSRRPVPADARAGDADVLRPQPPHWPLIVMLTLLPWAINQQVAAVLLPAQPGPGWLPWLPSALGLAGLGAASFHLGQPLRAWRVFLGLRRSWFSREAVLLGLWLGATLATLRWPGWRPAAAALGLAGLACSVMIYVDTRRSFWRVTQTAPRFLGGGLTLALATIWPHAALVTWLVKLAIEFSSLAGDSASARLQRGPLAPALLVRLSLGGLGLALLLLPPTEVTRAAGLAALVAGETAERYLFFRAVDAPKMPGQADPRQGGHA